MNQSSAYPWTVSSVDPRCVIINQYNRLDLSYSIRGGCPGNSSLRGDYCVCSGGFKESGNICVPDDEPCPSGQHLENGQCVPNNCSPGTFWNNAAGKCLCGNGSEPVNGQCESCERDIERSLLVQIGWGYFSSDPNRYPIPAEGGSAQIVRVNPVPSLVCQGGCQFYLTNEGDAYIEPTGGRVVPVYSESRFKSNGNSCEGTDDLDVAGDPPEPDNDFCPDGQVVLGYVNGEPYCGRPPDGGGGGGGDGDGDSPGGGNSGGPSNPNNPGGSGGDGGDGGDNGGSGGGGGNGGDGEGEESGLCRFFPNILACQNMGELPANSGIPRDTKNIGLIPESVLPLSGNCPADPSITIYGRTMLVPFFSNGCQWIYDYLRPMVFVISSFFALMIALGSVRND